MTTTPLDPKAIRDAIELRLHQMNTYGESPAHVADHLLSLLKVAPVAARPLSSITDGEAREAFRVAMPEGKAVNQWSIDENGNFTIFDTDYDGFDLSSTGFIRPSTFMDIAQEFNAPALINYIRSIGIAFESVT